MSTPKRNHKRKADDSRDEITERLRRELDERNAQIRELMQERDELQDEIDRNNEQMTVMVQQMNRLVSQHLAHNRINQHVPLTPPRLNHTPLARDNSPVPPAHWTPTQPTHARDMHESSSSRQLFEAPRNPFELTARPFFPPHSPKSYENTGRKRW